MAAKRRRYKKLSTTNSHYQEQLKETTFYLERSLGAGKIVVGKLRKAGLKVESHAAWFRHDTEDTDWLTRVGANQWIVLMRDKKIGKRILELDALLDGGVKSFVLVSGQLTDAENAAIIIKALPKILEMIAQNDFPFIAKIYRDGKVELWKTKRMIHKGIQKKRRKK